MNNFDLKKYLAEGRLLKENKILVPRRDKEERVKNHNLATQKKIQQYIKDGSKGNLNLENSQITSLPDNFQVGGDLNLRKTKITSLPDNLQVGGYLDLDSSQITSLPNNLQVGGDLNLDYTPLSYEIKDSKWWLDFHSDLTETLAKKQVKKIIKKKGGEVKGRIYI